MHCNRIVVGTVGAIKNVRRMGFPIVSAIEDVVDAHNHGVAIKGAPYPISSLNEGIVKVSCRDNRLISVRHGGVVEIATDDEVAVLVLLHPLCDVVCLTRTRF